MHAGTALWRGHKVNPQSSESLKSFLSLSNAMQSHVVAFSALVIPKIVNARRGNKSKFSQDILLLGGQSIWNTRKATQRLTLIQDPSKERVCAIAAPNKKLRECVSVGAAGAQTRRSLGHHLLHPQILRP